MKNRDGSVSGRMIVVFSFVKVESALESNGFRLRGVVPELKVLVIIDPFHN